MTVENFRSITAARKLQISRLTTLVGPNNEGKSNILRAIVIAMNVIVARRNQARYPIRSSSGRVVGRRRRRYLSSYDWIRRLSVKDADETSTKRVEDHVRVRINGSDVTEFYTAIGNRLNGTLPISIMFKQSGIEVTILKPGRGSKALNNKAPKIADFIGGKPTSNISRQSEPLIPALEIVEDLVEQELEKIEKDVNTQQAISDIASLQEPIPEDLFS